jgi:superfamily II DNA or RNA helicase
VKTMFLLRDYQFRDLSRLRAEFMRGHRRVCYQAPCGAGKTVLFVDLVRRIRTTRNQRVAIIVHRIELVDQTCVALNAAGLDFGVIAAGYSETDAPIQVAMAQTLANRLDRLTDIQFLILDECHHTLAATWLAILTAAPLKARVLGTTATPERLDGQGLASAFNALVVGPTVKELIAAGWLSPFVVYAPERMVDLKRVRTVAGDYALGDLAQRMGASFVLDDAIAEYRKHLDRQSAIAFAATIEHSRTVARAFRAAGIRAQHLDGDTPATERRTLIAALATGEVRVITNCNLIGEGLDIPSVAGVILLRPTKSLALYLQQIGRALRPAPGKDRAVVLDHAGNVFRHGMPDLEHAWTLEGRPKKKGKALVRRCPECGAVIAISAHECPECGANLRPAPVKPATAPDPLIEVDPATAHERWLAHGEFKAVTRWAGSDEARLHAIAAARGYKPGWVYWRLRAQRDAADAATLAAAWSE